MYHRFRRLRHDEREPDDPLVDDDAVEEEMMTTDPEWENLRFGAVREEEPGDLAGWLEVDMTREGSASHATNGHMAWVHVQVAAPLRGQGLGKQLLAKAAEVARERQRSLLIGGSDEATGKAFLKAMGAQLALGWRQSRLVLDEVDWGMVKEWVEDGRRRSPESQVVFFRDLPPEDLLEPYCALLQETSNREPRGDLEFGDEVVTPEMLKARVQGFLRGGGTVFRAIAREANGDLSGLTTMGYYPQEKTHIHQWMTGVGDAYLGRGLGKWLKAAMLLKVREELPGVRVVITGNATINAPMLSINVRLGFKPHREGMEGQIPLESLEAYLAG